MSGRGRYRRAGAGFGNAAALGFAEESGCPFEMALVRSHYVGRTFIEPRQSIRHFGVKIKFNPVAELLRGQADRADRGFTGARDHPAQGYSDAAAGGRREVHMRIAAPPTTNSCFYGIDTPTREELLASHQSVEEIRKYITADSLGYLSWDGLYSFLAASARASATPASREISGRDSKGPLAASAASVRRRRPSERRGDATLGGCELRHRDRRAGSAIQTIVVV